MTHYRGDSTPNTLDLIFTNESGMLDSLKYLAPVGNIYHSSLKMDFCCYTNASSTSKDRHIYDKGDYDKMREMMRSINFEMELSDKTVDERWITTMGTINDATRKCIPKRRSHGKGIRKKMKPIWMYEPPESRFPAPLCDMFYLQSLNNRIIPYMVSYCVAARPSSHPHLC